MIHEFNLHSKPFQLISEGKKDIEMRLYDDRRKAIKVDDEIIFTNIASQEKLTAIVSNLYRFNNFEELYTYIDKKRLGYGEEEIADPTDMELYYSKADIEKYGVLAIELER